MKNFKITPSSLLSPSRISPALAIILFVLLSLAGVCFGQEKTVQVTPLNLRSIEPYHIQVTYEKTSHLIFPATIRYVDLGSEYLVAGKAEGAENVLRIKAAIKDFEPETNVTVITNDGHFYSFSIFYSSYPEALSYDLQAIRNDEGIAPIHNTSVLFNDLGADPAYAIKAQMDALYKKNERMIKRIHTQSTGIAFSVKGIYIHHGKYYLHTEAGNTSHIPFLIDAVGFRIVDRKAAKRTAMQEKALPVLRTYKPLDRIDGKATDRNIFLLDQFTMKDDQILIIDLLEKNGGRHQVLKIKNKDLMKAHPLTGIPANASLAIR